MNDVTFSVDIQHSEALANKKLDIPTNDLFEKWVHGALKDERVLFYTQIMINIRIADEMESQTLNNRYRKKNSPTNVLAFPYGMDEEHLGDLVICAPLVIKEAKDQEKTAEEHWAHLVVHGCLHLVGFDHVIEKDAIKMESRETEILAELGYANPY